MDTDNSSAKRQRHLPPTEHHGYEGTSKYPSHPQRWWNVITSPFDLTDGRRDSTAGTATNGYSGLGGSPNVRIDNDLPNMRNPLSYGPSELVTDPRGRRR